MATDLFAPYKHLLFDLTEIRGLDLNWDHTLEFGDDVFPNFGVYWLYAIGHTGHNHLVACPIPGLSAEEYPIGVYGEEEGTLTVIAASIQTWLPAYLVYRVNRLLEWYWSNLRNGEIDAYSAQHLDSILNAQEYIRSSVDQFGNPDFAAVLDKVFMVIGEKDTLDHPEWNYAAFYGIAERGSYVGRYIVMMAEGASIEARTAAALETPQYNKPLFDLFRRVRRGRHAGKLLELVWDADALPDYLDPSLAHAVLQRRINHEGLNSAFINDLISRCAQIIYEEHAFRDSPLWPLVEHIATEGVDSEVFFQAGQRYEALGSTPEHLIQAITCYSNTLYLHGIEEEFHREAFEGIQRAAHTLGDQTYLAYLERLEQGVV